MSKYFPHHCSWNPLTLILLTWRIWWAPNNASRWQMAFNSAFKGLIYYILATDYGLDGPRSNPGWDDIFRLSIPALGVQPASCKMCTGSFTGVKCGRGVLLATHPLLVPRSWKNRTIPLPTLWAHRASNGVTLPLPLLYLPLVTE